MCIYKRTRMVDSPGLLFCEVIVTRTDLWSKTKDYGKKYVLFLIPKNLFTD